MVLSHINATGARHAVRKLVDGEYYLAGLEFDQRVDEGAVGQEALGVDRGRNEDHLLAGRTDSSEAVLGREVVFGVGKGPWETAPPMPNSTASDRAPDKQQKQCEKGRGPSTW